jgi:hypothetical protein
MTRHETTKTLARIACLMVMKHGRMNETIQATNLTSLDIFFNLIVVSWIIQLLFQYSSIRWRTGPSKEEPFLTKITALQIYVEENFFVFSKGLYSAAFFYMINSAFESF